MLSLIVVSPNPLALDDYVTQIVKTSPLMVLEAQDATLKLSDVKTLLQSLTTAPSLHRFVWLKGAHTLTLPAQNALLKVLEEPPAKTSFILTTPQASALLPTIRSRCHIIRLSNNLPSTPDMLAILKEALTQEAGNRLILAATLGRKRPELLTWVTQASRAVALLISDETNPKKLEFLGTLGRLLTLAHADLQRNVATNLVLQHLFLSLPTLRSRPKL